MQYLLLIYEAESVGANRNQADQEKTMGEWMQYTQAMQEAGVFKGGDALHGVSTATTVRHGGDKPLSVDGPFAETKEQLGGYYLIEVDNLDDAVAWAGKAPKSFTGCVEVRPVMTFG